MFKRPPYVDAHVYNQEWWDEYWKAVQKERETKEDIRRRVSSTEKLGEKEYGWY